MSESEGICHGIQERCIQRFSTPARRLRSDDGANPLPASRSSLLAANLRLAGLRSLPAISGAQPLSGVLAREARGTALFGDGRPFAPDQARRNPGGERRVPAALIGNREWRVASRARALPRSFAIRYSLFAIPWPMEHVELGRR